MEYFCSKKKKKNNAAMIDNTEMTKSLLQTLFSLPFILILIRFKAIPPVEIADLLLCKEKKETDRRL